MCADWSTAPVLSYPNLSDTSPHTIVLPPLLFCPYHQLTIIYVWKLAFLTLSTSLVISWGDQLCGWRCDDFVIRLFEQHVWTSALPTSSCKSWVYPGGKLPGRRFKVGAARFKQAQAGKTNSLHRSQPGTHGGALTQTARQPLTYQDLDKLLNKQKGWSWRICLVPLN